MTAQFSPLHRFGDVSVRLAVELGRADMPLKDVLALAEGSVVPLNRLTDELLELTANGRLIAHGEVVAENGRFSLRIVRLADAEPDDEAGAARGPKPDPQVPADIPAAPAANIGGAGQ